MKGYGRVGIYDRFNEARKQKTQNMTPAQKKLAAAEAKAKLLQPVDCAPVKGDPEAIDWEDHDCGYIPRTKPDGSALPKSGPNAEDAWRWTEEKPRGRQKPYLRGELNMLSLSVYGVGRRHVPVELYSESGFPDDMYWGPGGLIIREVKAMKPAWKRGQKQHLLSLLEAGQDVAVWFSCCLLSGHISEELAMVAGVEIDEKIRRKDPYARIHRGVPNRPPTWKGIADGDF